MSLIRVFSGEVPLYNSKPWSLTPLEVFIYTGGVRTTTDNRSTRKYKDNEITIVAEEIWSVDHGDSVRGIAVDQFGNVYTGGNRISNLTTRKYDSSGTLLWSRDHGNLVNGIAVDQFGNVYTVGSRTGPNLTTRKYDSSGTLLWSRDHGGNLNGIAVDQFGNVYTGGVSISNLTTRKYDSSGTLLWSVNHGGNAALGVYKIAVDQFGNVYTGGVRISNLTTRKYDSSGTLLWSVDHGDTVWGIAISTNVSPMPQWN